jgi:hypothetical protein
MRPIHWVAIILAANILHLWMFLHFNIVVYPVLARVGVGIHAAASIGTFWMLYDWFVRRNKRTWRVWLWLAFVPWGFVWYYFDQYRPSLASERSIAR